MIGSNVLFFSHNPYGTKALVRATTLLIAVTLLPQCGSQSAAVLHWPSPDPIRDSSAVSGDNNSKPSGSPASTEDSSSEPNPETEATGAKSPEKKTSSVATETKSSTKTKNGRLFVSCPSEKAKHTQIVFLPKNPVPDRPVRLIATIRNYSTPLELSLFNSSGKILKSDRIESWGHLPRAYSLYFQALPPGKYYAALTDKNGKARICKNITIKKNTPPNLAETTIPKGVWPVEQSWDPDAEDLFSVFIAKLFYVEPGSSKGWRPLHGATRDPFRNILYGILGLDEDNPKAEQKALLRPDCADAPYQIRAYFAWKMRLPFLYSNCNRGNSKKGPTCTKVRSNKTRGTDHLLHPTERFNRFIETRVTWNVQAGNFRTLPSDQDSDFYPIQLTEESIRPGVVFVDAGGHILMVTQWEPQTNSSLGAMYGVDAHPDHTVTHKRFSSGTFIFNHRVPTDGFKAFRPITTDGQKLRYLTNREILEKQGFAPFSPAQSKIASDEKLYSDVLRMLNPNPVNPKRFLESRVEILHSAMKERVQAVELAVNYMESRNWATMEMPNGPQIFQTEGPWETYSTPARDMRLFLAIDAVMRFPERTAEDLSWFDIPKDTDPQVLFENLVTLRDKLLEARRIIYRRSDGSTWELSLAELVRRQEQLEIAYNPNDCPETRWGAASDSPEANSCKRSAPHLQVKRMELFRRWFSSRRRPDQK